SVAWATERKDVLSGFFGILTLWAYAHYLQRPGLLRYLGMVAAFFLSLLAKPMLMTLPFVLLLLDYWPFRRLGTATGPGPRRAPFGLLVLEKAPLFVLAAAIAAVTMETREQHGAMLSLHALPVLDRLANALTAYGWYLGSTCYPVR